MALGERKLLTWTLNAGTAAYENDLEQYGNKIYALGVHECQVEYDGEIYIRRAIPSHHDGSNYGSYTWGNGSFIDNAVPTKNKNGRDWMGWSFWKAIERGMRRWPHIRHYPSFILFGGSRVTKMLDSESYQDNFIANCKKVIDNMMEAYNYPGSNKEFIKGIEIDFEASMSGSSYDYRNGDNNKYMKILKRVKEEICIPRGLVLQVNAYAMWGKDTPYYYRFHDYELFANTGDSKGNPVIDELQIMTYDFAWNGSAPGASTPLWWFDNVAAWAKKTFGGPKAKLTLNNVFFGSAGYGHRWGIYDYDRMYGSTITYRQFVDWQNGLYKHNHSTGVIGSDGQTIYNWHNQDFLRFAGIEDPESKNQVLQQHVYDYFKAKYGIPSVVNGTDTVRMSEYNGGEYATTYSRLQRSNFTGIQGESFAPSDTSATPKAGGQVRPYKEISDTGITIREEGKKERTIKGITGYQVYKSRWIPKTEVGKGTFCEKEQGGGITYTVNVPKAGSYKLVALVSFLWYNQAKLKGTFNGSSITIEPFADYYPLMFKASHWFDMGYKDFKAGDNTIFIDGDLGDPGTVIYGFVAAQDFKNNFAGGELTFKSTVKPFKKKDGTFSDIPENLSFTSKALRQDPVPLMMWEDRFDHYRRVVEDGEVIYKDIPDITSSSAYYTKNEIVTDKRGSGNTLSKDEKYCYDPGAPTYEIGYSTGKWPIKKANYNGLADDAYAAFEDSSGTGRLLVNYEFRSNMQVEAEVRVTEAGTVGIQFGGSGSTDGYRFIANYKTRKLQLFLNSNLLKEEALPANYALGDRTRLKAILHNGKGYFYFGYSDVKAFGGASFDLSRSSGGIAGLYASNVVARVYMLKVSTTDKWDLMEKFTVEATIKGKTYSQTFGAIKRKEQYTIDSKFGYLNYSGINELNTRELLADNPNDPESEFVREDVSLDYEFFINAVPGFEGAADIKVIFDDPGIWYAHLYVVDRAGGSITWVGDSHSFLDSMNRASNEVGAKGIGMWTMGQEEPRVFDTIPEIVSYHEAPPGI